MKCQTLSFVFALIIIQGHPGWARFSQRPVSQDFDILLLTQTWLPAICETPQRSQLPYYCSVAHTYNRWSIHGLWPHKRNGVTPEFCADIPLEDTKIQPLKNRLEYSWVDVFAVNTKETNKMRNFWEKQWKKHGTCAVKPTDKTAQHDYFQKTLFLFQTYNMDNILERAGVVPGKEYTYLDLLSKIENQVGKECQIACYIDDNQINPASAVQYLTEVRICFGRDFINPTNCGKSRLPTCRRSLKIIYSQASSPNSYASASTGPNQMNPPAGNAPKTNPNGYGSREYSFGIGLQGPKVRRGP